MVQRCDGVGARFLPVLEQHFAWEPLGCERMQNSFVMQRCDTQATVSLAYCSRVMLRGLFLRVLEEAWAGRAARRFQTHIPRHQASRSALPGRQTAAMPLFAFRRGGTKLC